MVYLSVESFADFSNQPPDANGLHATFREHQNLSGRGLESFPDGAKFLSECREKSHIAQRQRLFRNRSLGPRLLEILFRRRG